MTEEATMVNRKMVETTVKTLFAKEAIDYESTIRTVREKVAKELEIDIGLLKEKKEMLKEVLIAVLNNQEINKKKVASKENVAVDPRLKQLQNLATAMKVGPSLYRGLANIDIEQRLDQLRSRLRDKGAIFKGEFPTEKEISVARVKRQREDDLQGIDTSNILSASKRTRRSFQKCANDKKAIRKKSSPSSNSSSSSDDDDSADEDDNNSNQSSQSEEEQNDSQTNKTSKKPMVQDEDSEEEFQF